MRTSKNHLQASCLIYLFTAIMFCMFRCPHAEELFGGSTDSNGLGRKDVKIEKAGRKDAVVSARDTGNGLPGGTMQIKVTVPAGMSVKLALRKKSGSSGSAFFDDARTQTEKTDVTGSSNITIYGDAVSSDWRNMTCEALSGAAVKASFDFTVFRVEAEAIITGNYVDAAATILPKSVTSSSGNQLSLTLSDSADYELGSHIKADRDAAYGSIVIRGKIVPATNNPENDRKDFSSARSRSNAFNWNRVMWGRTFNGSGCLFPLELPRFTAADSLSDDPSDGDEDLTPYHDLGGNSLYVWVIDSPNISSGEMSIGQTMRRRYQFTEVCRYAGVQTSNTLQWFWRASVDCVKQDPPDVFQTKMLVSNTDYEGQAVRDNLLGIGTTPLTANLGAPSGISFTVTGSTPSTARESTSGVVGTISGTGLNQGTCAPFGYMIREQFFDRYMIRTVIRLKNTGVTGTTVSGTYDIPGRGEVTGEAAGETGSSLEFYDNAHLGEYKVVLFVGDGEGTSPDKITVTR